MHLGKSALNNYDQWLDFLSYIHISNLKKQNKKKNCRLCAESLDHETTNSALQMVSMYDFTNNMN